MRFIPAITCCLLTFSISQVNALNTSDWETYRDSNLSFELKYPADDENMECGVGKYGSVYEEQFGCKGKKVKLLVLPWVNKKGVFDLNVQSSFVRGKPEVILDEISKALTEHGYSVLPLPHNFPNTLRFGKESTGREVWYIRNGDLLLELNIKYKTSSKYADTVAKEIETLRGVIGTVGF